MSILEELWGVVLTSSFYATIVGLSIIAIQILLNKKLSPRWNYLIWLVLIIKLIVPFGPESDISIFNKLDVEGIAGIYQDKVASNQGNDLKGEGVNLENENKVNENIYEEVPVDNGANGYGSPYEEIPTENTIKSESSNGVNYTQYISVAWAVIAINLFIFIVITFTLLNIKLRKNNFGESERLNKVFLEAKNKIKTGKRVKLVISKYISTPALSGYIRPRVLIPENMIDLSEKELEYIFLHELSHYKRKDILVNYILMVLQCVHWFNPFMWFFFKKIKEDMEFATDERVLHILEDKEHKAYGLALLTVLSKVNNSVFYPRLVSMSNDKKRVEKRIKNIKYIDYIKSKKVMFSVIGVVILVILVPIMLTSKSKGGLSELQQGYLDIIQYIEEGNKIDESALESIIQSKNFVKNNQDNSVVANHYQYAAQYNAIEYIDEKEAVALVYFKNEEGKEELEVIQYINDLDKDVDNINLSYSLKGELASEIEVKTLEAQMGIVNSIDLEIESKELIDIYFNICNTLEKKDIMTKEDLLKIESKLEHIERDEEITSSMDRYYIADGKAMINIDCNPDIDMIAGIILKGGTDYISFRPLLPIYPDQYSNLDTIGNIVDSYSTIEEQRSLMLKIQRDEFKSSEKYEFDNELLLSLHNKEENIGMVLREDISYSALDEFKLRSMEDSIEYVKNNTDKNIKEVDRTYEDEVGVSEVTYESESKKYVVRYMHPYKVNSYGVEDGYDLDKTAGIWVEESVFNIN